jgi:hypothetical protein
MVARKTKHDSSGGAAGLFCFARAAKGHCGIPVTVNSGVYSVFERSVERFAVHENASKYEVRASVLIHQNRYKAPRRCNRAIARLHQSPVKNS